MITRVRSMGKKRFFAGALMLASFPAQAQDDRPVTRREPDVMDVARTPITDLNLARREIPALLAEAQQRPYSLVGLDKCDRLIGAVNELNAVLGPDIDLPQEERRRFSEGRIAQSLIGRFIPFRSVVRELSGANRQEREFVIAIQAGLARRGFLKGVGAARGCRYPASPATETIVAQHRAALEAEDAKAEKDGGARIEPDAEVTTSAAPPPPAAKPQVIFKSEPVVQPTR